jgi:hypothetical protein
MVAAGALSVYSSPHAYSASYRTSASPVCVTLISIGGQANDTASRGTPIRVCIPPDQIPASVAPAKATVKPSSVSPSTTGSKTGYPTVGKFFFKVAHIASFNCTGTVISAPSDRTALVLVAAHCLYGDLDYITYGTDHWKFVPEWHDDTAPLGSWEIENAYYPSLWPYDCHLGHCDFNPRYDFALLTIEELSGSDGWAVNEPKTVTVTIAGIPGNSDETLINRTVSHTVSVAGYDARKATTPGFGNGSSGGPWFYEYSTSQRIGDVLGDIGGYQDGGNTDSPSYSPFWTRYFATIVTAVAEQEK